MIWARIEVAISPGVSAAMSRPIGAWMRVISVSEKPAALSRPTRLACVLREPSEPM